jgi:hypothetical protein
LKGKAHLIYDVLYRLDEGVKNSDNRHGSAGEQHRKGVDSVANWNGAGKTVVKP